MEGRWSAKKASGDSIPLGTAPVRCSKPSYRRHWPRPTPYVCDSAADLMNLAIRLRLRCLPGLASLGPSYVFLAGHEKHWGGSSRAALENALPASGS
jgi:hypothetical protein